MLTNLFINMCVFVFLRKQAGDCTISMVQVKCAGISFSVLWRFYPRTKWIFTFSKLCKSQKVWLLDQCLFYSLLYFLYV